MRPQAHGAGPRLHLYSMPTRELIGDVGHWGYDQSHLQDDGCYVINCKQECAGSSLMCATHAEEWTAYRRNAFTNGLPRLNWKQWLGVRPTTLCAACDEPIRLSEDYLCPQCRSDTLSA